ncbi:uncharacterized protein LOC114391698 [Glycine soja]|uniref:uncharacterized protein n=1 Tax=Glycine max TaxID=3847 RepID=UPI0003DECE3E|nr:uncharacterized protein LOC100791212 [Glycine max]XP_028208472.1 uncharacterized protein LOC114391698 [Glycine soja]|eukprot:XP_006601654.1 uncharacterized protein LOC100791212 [Glycine max]
MAAPTKDFVFCANIIGNGGSGKEPPDGGGSGQTRVSFKEMAMANREALPQRPKVDLIKEKLAKIVFEDDNPLKPIVHIDDSIFNGLCAPWQDALVVKLLGKNIGFQAMKDHLTRIWKLVAGFDILDIGNHFYMVKFDTTEDRQKVIEGGPWMIFDHYLTIQTWTPDFISPTAKIDKTMVWVRFPSLNLIYYDENILLALARAIGTPIKVDSNTLDVRRGHFARICVQIDLNKPVVGKVGLKGYWYKKNLSAPTKFNGPKIPASITHANNCGNNGTVAQVNAITGKDVANNEKDVLHGEWLVVKRKPSNKTNKNQAKGNKDGNPKNQRQSLLNEKKEKINSITLNAHDTASGSHTDVAPTTVERSSNGKQKNKRVRRDTVTIPRVSQDPRKQIIIEKTIINKPKPINGEHVGPSNHPSRQVIYNAGYGIKSTVPMQALSPNRFIILNDEEPVAQNMDIIAVDSQEHMGQHDMVLETPLEGQPAAT